MKGVLFLCVANSARSQMAEGLARSLAPRGLSVFSAGSKPASVHPVAVQVMAEMGVDVSAHKSKGIDQIPIGSIGTVVTLCNDEICPVFPHPVLKVHWPLPDPAAVKGSRETRLRAFRRLRTDLHLRIGRLLETIR